jgi:hypothetical protein
LKKLTALVAVLLSFSCADIDEALERRRDAGGETGGGGGELGGGAGGGPTGGGGGNIGIATDAGVCRNGFCWENPLPQGNNVRAVFGNDAGEVWLVGDVGTVLRWTPAGFENHSPQFPATHALRSVWGVDGEVWVVGLYDDTGTATRLNPMHYAAGAWNQEPWMPSALTPDLISVRGHGQQLWASGNSGVIAERTDAGRWQARVFPQGSGFTSVALTALAFDSEGRCMVALNGDLRGIAPCDGGALELSLDASYDFNPNALWSTAPGVFHAGLTRTRQDLNSEGNLWLRAPDGGWALEDDQGPGTGCLAGFAQGSNSVAWCGNSVLQGTPPMAGPSMGLTTLAPLFGMWSPASTLEGAWLVGGGGVLYQLQNNEWVERHSGPSDNVYSIWVDDQRVLGVGGGGALFGRGSDSRWSVEARVGAGTDLEDLWVSADGTFHVYVGIGRTLLEGSPGSVAQPVEVIADGTGAHILRSVWGTSQNDLWAVGSHGEIWHRDALAWSRSSLFADGGPNLFDVDGTADGGAYIVGEACTILMRDDSADGGWRPIEPRPPLCTENLYGVWAAPPNDAGYELIAVGEPNVARVRRNGVWQATNPGAPGDLYKVWGSSPNDLWAVGRNGGLVHHDGGRWERVETGTRTPLGAVRGRRLVGGALELFIGGENGAVLRRVLP